MPERVYRKAEHYVEDHPFEVIMLLLVALVVALIFAISGYTKARNVENTLQAERLGKAIADVTTCFNSAERRPQLEVILRGIASELQPDPRAALNGYIDDYTKNTPTRDDCVELAESHGIDPQPYLNNPPSEAGKQEDR